MRREDERKQFSLFLHNENVFCSRQRAGLFLVFISGKAGTSVRVINI